MAYAVALGLIPAACGQDNRYVAPPPPPVSVALPLKQEVTRYLEATGNAAAVNTVNLVARVQGFLQKIEYKDGDEVKQGATLFVIEPEPYQLKLQQAQAAEAAARATMVQTQADYDRQVELASRQVASKAALDNALANRDTARARFAQAQVDSDQARINLGYTQVKAPFDGIVTARQVSVGELVGASGPTQLATIVSFDPIYVNFNVSEQDVLRIRSEMRQMGLTPQDLKQIPVEVGLQNEQGFPHRGSLYYASPTMSQSTGTLAARAIFSNPDRVLLPGFFVRVRIPEDQQNVLLVPDAALGSDQGGRYLLVVGNDNVVQQRNVTLGIRVGNLRVIESGLDHNDRVVVGGIVHALPGQKVDPQLQSISAAK